jgi:uncharacterized membrane protein
MIACMVSGRLKEKAKWHLKMPRVTTITTATMIATDASNRARVIELETDDEEIGRPLRALAAGDTLTVTGATTLLSGPAMMMRVRTLTTIQDACVVKSLDT